MVLLIFYSLCYVLYDAATDKCRYSVAATYLTCLFFGLVTLYSLECYRPMYYILVSLLHRILFFIHTSLLYFVIFSYFYGLLCCLSLLLLLCCCLFFSNFHRFYLFLISIILLYFAMHIMYS